MQRLIHYLPQIAYTAVIVAAYIGIDRAGDKLEASRPLRMIAFFTVMLFALAAWHYRDYGAEQKRVFIVTLISLAAMTINKDPASCS